MKRRDFITLLGGIAASWPGIAAGQGVFPRPLIGFLSTTSASTASRYVNGFLAGLHDLKYVEGHEVDLAFRYADGDLTKMATLISDLFRLHPGVFITGSTAASIAVKQATVEIPIICAALTDPIGVGLVASYARPGGNVTGLLNNIEGLPGKRLELSREVVTGARKIGMLVNPRNPSNSLQRLDTLSAATVMGVEIVATEIQSAAEIQGALEFLAQQNVEFLIVLQDPLFNTEGKRIAKYAIELRLPSMHGFRENVEDGGLLSYGINLTENFRRAAALTVQVLQGTKPSDLPVELPTKLELVINLRTARMLGLTISPTLLARADEVIE